MFDLYLPTTHIYERESLIYNLFAQKTVTKFIYSPVKLSKDLGDIYKYFIELYSLINVKELTKLKFYFKYNKLIKKKYLNIFLLKIIFVLIIINIILIII